MGQKFLLLILAGALGTLFRYGLAGTMQRTFDSGFPWGTFTVNLVGCFLAGLFWSISESRLSISGETRTVVLIGFMGAFTTFSAFILETGQLFREAQWLWAIMNLSAQNVFGLVLFFVGLGLGRFI
jgi:CrcB protein